jgi:hypothetical protein
MDFLYQNNSGFFYYLNGKREIFHTNTEKNDSEHPSALRLGDWILLY